MSAKSTTMPAAGLNADSLAQEAQADYEAAATTGYDASAKAAASEAVGGLRSTGAVLEETAADAAGKLAAAKDSTATAASDLSSSAMGTATDVGHKLSAAAEEAAARASEAAATAGEKAQEAQAGGRGGSGSGASTSGSGDGWSWEGFKEEAARKWDDWQQLPGQWGEQSKQAAQDLGHKFSWQTVEDWQERHWQAFEERQRARLAALTEEQRQRWEELEKEGKELWQKEKGAWEEWQQRWWERNHPEEAKAKQAASKPCKQCTLTYLMLPLLPDFKENIRTFGRRTKMGIVGEMRDAGTKLADSAAAVGEKLGFGGKKG